MNTFQLALVLASLSSAGPGDQILLEHTTLRCVVRDSSRFVSVNRGVLTTRAASTPLQGIRTDQVVRYVLDAAVEVGMEVALHLEPYEDRSAETVRDDIRYIFDHYGAHAALHKGGKKKLPMLYVYDSYRIPTDQWLRLLHADGDLTIRGKNFDACVLGLWLDHHDGTRIKDGGFDGMYTYFAADGFTVCVFIFSVLLT